jgi:hypothetical protein
MGSTAVIAIAPQGAAPALLEEIYLVESRSSALPNSLVTGDRVARDGFGYESGHPEPFADHER